MKRSTCWAPLALVLAWLSAPVCGGQRAWQTISIPSAAKVTRERRWQRMPVLGGHPAGQGTLEVRSEYRTSATRYIHSPGFTKDAT